jgi:membrane protein
VTSVRERLGKLRRDHPLVDHAARTQEHYSDVQAGRQAGAVTYFAFLSFFPILALAFFVVGWIAKIWADAQETLTEALDAMLPDLLGDGQGQIALDDIQRYASTLGVVGAVVLLYSGLGWLSAMRDALMVVFVRPAHDRPNLVLGKLRDLVALVLIGTILLVTVAVAGLVGAFSTEILGWLELDEQLGWLVKVLTLVLGLATSMLLFYALFVLLARPEEPRRALWSGALLGAVAFELLKQVSGQLIQLTQGSPAFQAFGIALIVLVWINYFSRVVMYAAAWSHTSAAARAARPAPAPAGIEGPPSPPVRVRDLEHPWAAPYAAGAATMLGLVALARRLSGRGAGRSAGPS